MQKVRWLILFLLFSLPITFFPYIYLAFELPKIFILYLMTVLITYLLLMSGYKLTKFTKIHWLFTIFLVWTIFASIIGLSVEQSFWGSYFRMQGILSYLCYGLLFLVSGKIFSDISFRKDISVAIFASSLFTACLGLIQFISLWFFGNVSQLLYSNRVISTFGQPNFLGAFLVMSLPFVWYLFKKTESKWRIFIGLSMVFIIMGVISTFSRSAYLGLGVLAILWGFYHYRLLLTGIVFLVLLFAILGNLFPDLVYREWFRFQVDTIHKWTAENRVIIARKSIKLIGEKPLTGYGLENFSLAFPSVVTENDLGLKDIVVDSAHNLFLDLSVQIGLIGIGLFIVLVAGSIIVGLKNLSKVENEDRDFIRICLCTITAFLIIHQFSPYSIVPLVLFWVSMGVVNQSVIEHSSITKTYKIILSLIFVPLLILNIGFIIQTLRADSLFHQSSTYEVSDINRSIKLDNDAITLAPWVNFYRVRRNFLLKQLGY